MIDYTDIFNSIALALEYAIPVSIMLAMTKTIANIILSAAFKGKIEL